MKKIIGLLGALCGSANVGAALLPTSTLLIGQDSYWEIEGMSPVAVSGHDHLRLGTAQSASVGHFGLPDGSENPGIDAPMEFFNNTVLHQTTAPVSVLSASGNTATLDFSGWEWVWHLYSHSTATGAWTGNPDGVADVTCQSTCADGEHYMLSYSGTIEIGTGSGIGGERYELVLHGTVSAVPVPAAAWLFASGLVGLLGLARRRKFN